MFSRLVALLCLLLLLAGCHDLVASLSDPSRPSAMPVLTATPGRDFGPDHDACVQVQGYPQAEKKTNLKGSANRDKGSQAETDFDAQANRDRQA